MRVETCLEAVLRCAMQIALSAMKLRNGTPLSAGKASWRLGGYYPKYDDRTVLEAVLWAARTGAPWLVLSAEFGPWDIILSASVSAASVRKACAAMAGSRA